MLRLKLEFTNPSYVSIFDIDKVEVKVDDAQFQRRDEKDLQFR